MHVYIIYIHDLLDFLIFTKCKRLELRHSPATPFLAPPKMYIEYIYIIVHIYS